MASGQPVTYQVTRVTPDTQFPPGDQPVHGKTVSFSTDSGYNGSVFVPDNVFPDKNAMRRMIEAEIMLVAQAQSISGTVQAP